MKSQTKVPCISLHGVHDGRISKRYPENQEAEMQACFLKLQDLVPSLPQEKKVSKVQLLQHVIDYILDLEGTLDSNPIPVFLMKELAAQAERKPLGESAAINKSHREIKAECPPANC
ncbi:hypothetical protein CAPTEDRAFT_179064 [Capitella teleta]|uniref:BHLH domain-containing protein n=1 Tax=Capitella teleta TaxID=283909 RepID=R7T3Y9_CAPTE|nr:hypothetical protein CAPTEDRAFT_179064 [Capitella teleta]|eukprot:ELT87508.1 hypothetical protein CAPTEDRAFT_179064 [Capitella teleta]